jgi:hypothetical protein
MPPADTATHSNTQQSSTCESLPQGLLLQLLLLLLDLWPKDHQLLCYALVA